jgi:outer membrane protein assembly factor BamA
LEVAQLNMNGWRFAVATGPSLSEQKPHGSFEQELFWYKLWDNEWNFGIHEWLGYTDDRRYQSLYFLGGFDSIRGIPDGTIFGNKAFYTNVELRKILYRAYYTWIQGAVYVDHGSAAYDSGDWWDKDRMSAGLGIRIAVPQVHRLMLRVDYAWSLDSSGSSSISAGLNQFFDPYKPL